MNRSKNKQMTSLLHSIFSLVTWGRSWSAAAEHSTWVLEIVHYSGILAVKMATLYNKHEVQNNL